MTLVTAVMPTRGRPEWAAQAVQCFLAQTYPNKELFILDDEDEPSFPTWTPVEDVRYLRFVTRESIPVKRNFCCDVARGDIIIHFDSDDWSAPTRMADQVAQLEASALGMTGYHTALFYNATTHDAFRYKHGHPHYAIGSSLCFYKTFWREYKFPETSRIGSDNDVVRNAIRQRQITAVDGKQQLVCRIHPDNTSTKRTDRGKEYQAVTVDDVPAAFFQ